MFMVVSPGQQYYSFRSISRMGDLIHLRIRAVTNAFGLLLLLSITSYLGVDTLRVPSTAVTTSVYVSNPLFISGMAAVFAIYNSIIGVGQISCFR